MKLLTLVLFVLLAAVLAVVPSAVTAEKSAMILKSPGLVADFKSKLPSVMLFPNTNTTNITSWYTATFSSLQEVTNDTKIVQQMPLDNKLNWDFGDPYTKKDSNGSIIYTAVNLTASFSMQKSVVVLHFVWFMYMQETVVKNGQENVTAYANSLKWAMLVESWPFNDPSNSLQFVFQMTHVDSKKNETHSDVSLATNSSATEPSILHLPGDEDKELRVELSNTATLDGHVYSLITIVKNESDVLFRFNSFAHWMAYDPVARITDAEKGGANWWIYVAIGLVVVIAIVVSVIAVIGFALYKLVIEKRGPRYEEIR